MYTLPRDGFSLILKYVLTSHISTSVHTCIKNRVNNKQSYWILTAIGADLPISHAFLQVSIDYHHMVFKTFEIGAY